MRTFQSTAILAAAEASVYSLVYAGAQYSNTQTQLVKYSPGGFQVLQNGEIVLLGSSLVFYALGYYGLTEKNNEMAAFGITEGSFFLISLFVSILERYAVKRGAPAALAGIARAKRLAPNRVNADYSGNTIKLANKIKLAN